MMIWEKVAMTQQREPIYAIGDALAGAGPDRHMVVLKRAGSGWQLVYGGTQAADLTITNGGFGAARIKSRLAVLGTAFPASAPASSGATHYWPISLSQDGGVSWSVQWVPVVAANTNPDLKASHPLQKVIAGSDRFVALFSEGDPGGDVPPHPSPNFNPNPSFAAYSDDGITWASAAHAFPLSPVFTSSSNPTAGAQFGFSNGFRGGIFGGGQFVINTFGTGIFSVNPLFLDQLPPGPATRSIAERLFSSADGATFTARVTTTEDDNYQWSSSSHLEIGYQPGRGFFALARPVGGSGTALRVLTSADGQSWIDQGEFDTGFSAVAMAAGTRRYALFAVGSVGATEFFRSIDGGVTWTHCSSYPGVLISMYATTDRFYAVVGTSVISSVDGATWIDEHAPSTPTGETSFRILALC